MNDERRTTSRFLLFLSTDRRQRQAEAVRTRATEKHLLQACIVLVGKTLPQQHVRDPLYRVRHPKLDKGIRLDFILRPVTWRGSDSLLILTPGSTSKGGSVLRCLRGPGPIRERHDSACLWKSTETVSDSFHGFKFSSFLGFCCSFAATRAIAGSYVCTSCNRICDRSTWLDHAALGGPQCLSSDP